MASITSLIFISILIVNIKCYIIHDYSDYVSNSSEYDIILSEPDHSDKELKEKINRMQSSSEKQDINIDKVEENIQENREDNLNKYLYKIESIQQNIEADLEELEKTKSELVHNIDKMEEIFRNAESKSVISNSNILEGKKGIKEFPFQISMNIKLAGCLNCDEISSHNPQNQIQNFEPQLMIKDETKRNDDAPKIQSTENFMELFEKYSQLIAVYKKELEEVKKLIETNNESKNEMNINEEDDDEDSSGETSTDRIDAELITTESSNSATSDENPKYSWVKSDDKIEELSENAVLGGEDIDKAPLYVIRSKIDGSYFYGKYAFSSNRKHAYVTDENREFETRAFEILTANKYFWCSSKSSRKYNEEFPICRATHNGSIIPGTLLANGSCRIGYGWKIEILTQDFEIFSLSECKN